MRTGLLQFIETSDKVKLYARISGKGPVCIFVHGGPGAWSRSFEELKGKNLEQNLTMVYYDQRGCGRSEISADKNYSLARMADDIEDIRLSLKAEKIYLLSHSFGGIIAVSYAKKYPDRLYGLILVNSTLSLNDSLESQIKFINKLIGTNYTVTDKNSITQVFTKARDELSAKGLEYKMLSDNKKTVEMLDSIDNSYDRANDFAIHFRDFKEYGKDFTKDTKNIIVPVLIIAGKKDHAVGADHYRLFQFPDKKEVIIDSGHVLYYEKNKAFIEAVFSFVKKMTGLRSDKKK